ncbi:KTSC domain-containing protein [Gilvimarinus agarilyticus]|uniref:KTSC domain-containing protein n=1 Tax=Gilvimarinus sp. 2_MG-2023 TaxID=3062666 RepID=UPI001C081F8B|nr:KTSC domain-containing protein [Gilvimarinus sp. 2_MG-2023]MBU2886196.1 KTSC domain-containing protein [Gilvimarinus agarilyticus]MDO6570885.1 KTSC domain-containing protein [Gilvimarinus sp. 2_MG-2023]
MKLSMLTTIIIIITFSSSHSFAICENNIDNTKTYYINGMFTTVDDYFANKSIISELLDNYFPDQGFSKHVYGSHNNKNEKLLYQAAEVARQKIEDNVQHAKEVLISFLNNETSNINSDAELDVLKSYLQDISRIYKITLSESDTLSAENEIIDLLNTCSRVILITHSQGNFYGNAIYTNLYANYKNVRGYSIAKFPMLGMMQIASPVQVPGGSIAQLHPDMIGHLTNDNDLIMKAVRETLGAVESNFSSSITIKDLSGHSLNTSYLTPPEQSSEIAGQIDRIRLRMIPYPMQHQNSISSSAFASLGHSTINKLLDLKFTDGSVYRYSDVSDIEFLSFISSASLGLYFNENIKNIYQYSKIH